MGRKSVLLIHPPVVRPCEPPPGLARLAGALKHSGVDCRIIDANLGGLLGLCKQMPTASDTWTRRAASGTDRNLTHLSRPEIYSNIDRYRQAVYALNRMLAMNGRRLGVDVGLSDYQDDTLSPTNSRDLAEAFSFPEKNPFYDDFFHRLHSAFHEKTPDLVGISLNFLGQALCAFAIAGLIRRLAPKMNIAFGGSLVTSWMKQPNWKNPFEGMIDHMISGPGEAPILSLLTGTAVNSHTEPDFTDLFRLPYLSPGLILPYSASNGCYWRRCAFCPEKTEGNRYRPIPAARAVSQLKTLTATYHPALLHLTDNALGPALLKALAADPPGAPWYGFVRITPHLADPDFCEALKRSGCVMLQIGLESGSQAVLDAFGKGIDLAVARKALLALKKAGIATYVYLLFGTPWETEKDALQTLDMTVRHCGEITFLNLAVFNLPAHAPESGTLETHAFYRGDLSLYRDFSHPEGWRRQDVRQFLDKKFKRHPEVAAIVRRDPPVFTSSHAPFFVMDAIQCSTCPRTDKEAGIDEPSSRVLPNTEYPRY